MAKAKPNFVEIWIYRGKRDFLKKTTGKIYGGIVNFKEADPAYPVIWLGQKSYIQNNVQTKKIILLYDSLTKTLFQPADVGTESDNVDMVAQTTQNILHAAKESQQAMGIQDVTDLGFKYGLAILILFTLLTMVFLYLFYTHMPGYSNAVTTTIRAVINGTTTTTSIAQPLGPSLIPKG